MKTKTLYSALLATLILGGTATSVLAEDLPNQPMTTNGTVTVTDGKIDPGDGVTDPEDPDKELPVEELPNIEPNPNPNTGPLEISHAPNLNFGEVKTATKVVDAFAAPNTFTNAAGPQSRGAILQFGDLRTTAAGYTVSGKMTKQFTQGTNELTGSTITFTNPLEAKPVGSTGILPEFEPNVVLSFNESMVFATADGSIDKEGKGMWTVEYGSSNGVEDTTANSVQLSIPANTASSMAGGAYVADIEWSILAAPGA